MCYDDHIISAYVDGELEEPRLTEVKRHIENCERCRNVADRYSSLEELFTADDSADRISTDSRKAQVWQRIQRQTRRETTHNFWHQRVQVPLPLAAGAVIAVAALVLTLLVSPFSAPQQSPQQGVPLAIQQDTTIPEVPSDFTSPANTMPEIEQLVKFLSDQGAAIEVKIQLPSSSKIQVSGEPQLLRAADLRRDEIE